MFTQHVLVTGGAGYVGSHTARLLLNEGYKVTVLDSLYSGHKWAVDSRAEFVEGSTADTELLKKLFVQSNFEAVIHFAAHIDLEESVRDPLKYYRNNVCSVVSLLEACAQNKVNKFIFSSTAAVYGGGHLKPISEETTTNPTQAYGRSNLMVEQILQDLEKNINSVVLRYFNAAGASFDQKLGQATPHSTHLIKVACEVACGVRDHLRIFGTDYSTPDGTCVRDYIHVEDLASAHLVALRSLMNGGNGQKIYNCGYGKGYSVREVISAFNRILGNELKVVESPRRPGDAENLIADSARLRSELGWVPQHDNIELICKTAYEWEKKYLSGKY